MDYQTYLPELKKRCLPGFDTILKHFEIRLTLVYLNELQPSLFHLNLLQYESII